jgi:ribosome assembly protein 4
MKERALKRYNAMKGMDPERLVSGSDDFTLFLWSPAESKKAVARMTGKGARRDIWLIGQGQTCG